MEIETHSSIDKAIESLEIENSIKIFSVRDFGSRARGLAGPESDKDIMFLFTQEPMEYITLDGYMDTIHTERFGNDFQGWNLQKFAELYADSNPQTIEYLNSPLHYYEEPEYIARKLQTLREHGNNFFKPISLYYHYLKMAKGNYLKYIADTIYNGTGGRYRIDGENEDSWLLEDGTELSKDEWEKGTNERTLKRNLFTIRGILCAQYVRRTHAAPPMDFEQFIREADMEMPDKDKLLSIIERKTGDADSYENIGNPFKEYIEAELDYIPDSSELDCRGIDRKLANNAIRTILFYYYE